MSIKYDYIDQPIPILANPAIQTKGIWPGIVDPTSLAAGDTHFVNRLDGCRYWVPDALWKDICSAFILTTYGPGVMNIISEKERASLIGQDPKLLRLNADAFGLGLVTSYSSDIAVVDKIVDELARRQVSYSSLHNKSSLLACAQQFGQLLDICRWPGQLFCFIFDILLPQVFNLELQSPASGILRVKAYNNTNPDWSALLSYGLAGLRMTARNAPQTLLPLAAHWPEFTQLEVEINSEVTVIWAQNDEFPTFDDFLNDQLKDQHHALGDPTPEIPQTPDLPSSPDPCDWFPEDAPAFPSGATTKTRKSLPTYRRNYQSLANEGLLGPSLYWWTGDAKDAAHLETLKNSSLVTVTPAYDRPRDTNLLGGSWIRLTSIDKDVGQPYFHYDGVIDPRSLRSKSEAYRWAYTDAILHAVKRSINEPVSDQFVFDTAAEEHFILLTQDHKILDSQNENGSTVAICLPNGTAIRVRPAQEGEQEGWYLDWRNPILRPSNLDSTGLDPEQSLELGKVICLKSRGVRSIFPPSIHADLLKLELERFNKESEEFAKNTSTEAGGKTNDPEDLGADPELLRFIFLILVIVALFLLLKDGGTTLILPSKRRDNDAVNNGFQPNTGINSTRNNSGSMLGRRDFSSDKDEGDITL